MVGAQLNETNRVVIEGVLKAFESLTNFTPDDIQQAMKSVAESLGIKPGKVMGPTRLAVTGSKAGPGVTDLISILGKQQVTKNISNALRFIDQS